MSPFGLTLREAEAERRVRWSDPWVCGDCLTVSLRPRGRYGCALRATVIVGVLAIQVTATNWDPYFIVANTCVAILALTWLYAPISRLHARLRPNSQPSCDGCGGKSLLPLAGARGATCPACRCRAVTFKIDLLPSEIASMAESEVVPPFAPGRQRDEVIEPE